MTAPKLALLALLLAASTARAGDGCDRLLAAIDKSGPLPVRTVFATIRNGATMIVRTTIVIGDTAYGRTDPSEPWRRSRYDAQAKLASLKASIAEWDPVCQADGSETIDGETDDILLAHNRRNVPARFWIARATGLFMKFEMPTPDSGREVVTMDYKDVAPPEDVAPEAKP